MRQSPAVLAILFCLVVGLLSPRLRADEPATQPQMVHVTLPDGWVAKRPTVRTAKQFAELPEITAFFELIAESKSDFTDDTDLMAWAKIVKANGAKSSTLADRAETDLKNGAIAGRPTVEYEITGSLKAVKLHYRIIMLECAGYYCKLVCWTTPSHWTEAQPKFEELVPNLN